MLKPKLTLSLMSLLLLAGCATTPSSPVGLAAPQIKLFAYSTSFQSEAAAELDHEAPPCARDVPVKPCSALNRIAADYLYNRDQMRKNGQSPTP